MNTSAFRIEPHVGLKRSYKLDQLSYFCESCPRHRYSTDRGSLHYKLNEGVYHYFTLMINGQSPNSEFAGTYDYNDISCHDCPYGAKCDSRIRALPNFWGYKTNGAISFQQCPNGYCCSSAKCPSYNTCASHRAGVLCSQCEPGYAEALFSSKCVPSASCGPLWIWPFSAAMGMLYAAFLFFQKDVRDFIFTRPMEWDDLKCCANRASQTEYKMCKKDGQDKYDNSSNSLDGENGENGRRRSSAGSELPQQNGDILEHLAQPEDATNQHTYATNIDEQNINKMATYPGDQNEGIKTDEPTVPTPANRDMGAIYLIIIMYYFQDAQLFHVQTASSVPENYYYATTKVILMGLFKFRLEVAHFVDNVCLVPGLSASFKLLTRTLLVPYVLVLFGVIYVQYMCLVRLRGGSKEVRDKRIETFLSRLCTGFMLSLMFTYQRLATTTFKLLNCVPVGDHHVLFIDGSVRCYEPWQYGVIAYAMCCIVPFCGVLLLGPNMLKEGRISLPTFFTACLVPLPFVLTWTVIRVSRRTCCFAATTASSSPSHNNSVDSPHKQVVLKVLQGPFKELSSRLFGPVCWAGVLILRRLILVLLFTFITHSLIRIIGMLLVCFFVLLQHVHVQPYNDVSVNVAGSASVSALMLVGGINLVRAGFEVAEYVPQGPNAQLMVVMQATENVMMLWLPAAIMGLVTVGFITKILFTLARSCKNKGGG